MADLLFPQVIPAGRCHCGCGGRTAIAKENRPDRNQFKGQSLRYIGGHSANHRGGALRERLFAQLVIDSSGCLLWTGSTGSGGYGLIKVDRHYHSVHRVMYEMFVGEIPDGLELDHVKAWGCTNRHCASPSHLEPVTSLENKLRTGGIITAHAAATNCGTCGTPYDEENTYWAPNGSRDCRICRRDRSRRHGEQKRRRAA